MRLDADEIGRALLEAGWSPEDARVALAVALAESGGRLDAVGDQSLADATWGPSVGLWQIRTLHRELGTGGVRDLQALTTGTARDQAARALEVWRDAGRSFSPWTVYKTGAYAKFLGQADAALSRLGAAVGDVASAPVGGLVGTVRSGATTLGTVGVAVLAGVALVVAGWAVIATSARRRVVQEVRGL